MEVETSLKELAKETLESHGILGGLCSHCPEQLELFHRFVLCI